MIGIRRLHNICDTPFICGAHTLTYCLFSGTTRGVCLCLNCRRRPRGRRGRLGEQLPDATTPGKWPVNTHPRLNLPLSLSARRARCHCQSHCQSLLSWINGGGRWYPSCPKTLRPRRGRPGERRPGGTMQGKWRVFRQPRSSTTTSYRTQTQPKGLQGSTTAGWEE